MTRFNRHSIWHLPALFCLWVMLLVPAGAALADEAEAASPVSVDTLIQQLVQGNLPQRTRTIELLASEEDDRIIDIFNALADGNLLADRSTPPRVAIRAGRNTLDALTGDTLEESALSGLRRVPVNNAQRTRLRGLLAQLNLTHENSDLRYQAVQRFIRDGMDSNSMALLIAHQVQEESGGVLDAIYTAIALYQIQSPEAAMRLSAIETLSGSLESEARIALNRVTEQDSEPALRAAATEALQSIQGKIRFYRFVENLFFGLSLGSVLLLAAIGLAITFGVMGVINMAHGELIMIGAYTTWGVQILFPGLIEWSLLIAIPSAFLIAALVGILIERGVIRFLYGRPLETLLATFGLSLVLQQAVRSLFGPLNRSVTSPEWISGTLTLNPVLSLTYTRLYILLFGLMVFFALLLVMKRTTLGLKVRAVSQNRAMARAVGVRSNWIDALTFGLGSGIAGVAGVALSQITNVGPNLGQAYIIDSFMVVVFGGVGNLWGTLVSAMSLGLINNFLEPYAGAMLAKVLVLIMLILFIQKKPKGLFPQKGRAAAD